MFFTPVPHLNQFLSETHAITRAFATPASEARKKKIDTLVRALKTAGSWAVMDALWVMAAHNEQAAGVNWKSPGTFALSPQSAIAFTADQGYTGDGTADYVSTGWNPATNGVNYTLDSAHLGLWIRTTSGASEDRTDIGATNGLRIDSRRVTNTFLARINNNNNNINGSNSTAGYFCVNRSASNAVQVRKNNGSLFTSTEASAAIQSATLMILALTAAANFSTKQASIAHVGGSLTTTQIDDTYAAFNAYMAGL